MNIVLDARVAAKWLLVEVDSDKADALFRAGTAKRIGLLAPRNTSGGSGPRFVEESDARPDALG
jgi:hypothetical protein